MTARSPIRERKSRGHRPRLQKTGSQSNLRFRNFGFPMLESCIFRFSPFGVPDLSLLKRGDVSGLPQHLVDFADMLRLQINMFARILLEHDVATLDQLQKLFIKLEGGFLMSERLAKNIADVVLLGFQQRSNPQRRMSSKLSDQFTGGSGVSHGLGRLLLEPLHNRYPVIAINHERVVGVMNGSRELHFENSIQSVDDLACELAFHD